MIDRDVRYQTTITMVTEICCNCGVTFAIPSDLRKCLVESKQSFYCPHGHGQIYSKSKNDELKEALKKKDEELIEEKRLAEQRISIALDRIIEEGNKNKELKKQLKRAHAGVCPCCNRSFIALANHIKTKHPEMVGKIELPDVIKKIAKKS